MSEQPSSSVAAEPLQDTNVTDIPEQEHPPKGSALDAAAQVERLLGNAFEHLVRSGDKTGSERSLFPNGLASLEADIDLTTAGSNTKLSFRLRAEAFPVRPRSGETLQRDQQAALSAPVAFQIRHHRNATMSNARADQILADGMALLRRVDVSGDVPCNVNLRRAGNVTSFSAGNGIIASQSDYDSVCSAASGPRILIVNQILFCGQGQARPGFIFFGCSDEPGECMVMTRMDASREPVLWMHEYGHNRGLAHRQTQRALMHPTIQADHNSIDRVEASAFEEAGDFFGRRVIPERSDEILFEEAFDLHGFVCQHYIHGVPETIATRLPPGATDALVGLLTIREYEPYWANIVSTLCMAGEPTVAEPLIQFLLRGEGTLSQYDYDAKCMVLMNLGRLLRRHGIPDTSQEFTLLRAGVDPNQLSDSLRWRNPYQLTDEEQRIQIAKMCVWGLALTGAPEADEVLRSIQTSEAFTRSFMITEETQSQSLKDLVDEALHYMTQPTK